MVRRSFVVAVIAVAVASAGGEQLPDRGWSVHSLTRATRAPGIAGASEPARSRTSVAWCGTPSQVDVTPNAIAGYAAHWIYVTPFDGADSFVTYASAMQTDAESIDAWWRSQDGTRTPRNDLTQLSCGPQLDLTQIRLSQSGAELADDDTRFVRIAEALVALGFSSRHTKYVVYYDGPSHPDICGQGGSHEDGYGYAIVYVRACAGVPPTTTSTHELLHTLGAVPVGAPHDCPLPHDGHVCDDSYDMMYPFGDETPISGLSLDSARDDYYAHAGSQLDVRDSPWLVQLDRQVPLQLALTGRGTVTADLPGLRCTESCTTAWNANTSVKLTGEPAPDAKLISWGAGCGAVFECSVSLSRATNVSVLFAPINVRLKLAVAGRGTVRASRLALACPRRCSTLVPSYVPLRLTAKATKGWRFKGWSGACRGRVVACTLPMKADAAARALFVRSA